MIREPVARRYARALFEASRNRKILDEVAGDLESIKLLLTQQPELDRLLTAPQIDQKAKKSVVGEVFTDRVHPLILELLYLLMDKKRLGILVQIIEGYRDLLEARRGITRAEVTTAVPLPEGQEQRLIERLEALTGQTILLEKRVLPAILGGMMVRLGDQIIDRSIRRTFEEMRQQLSEVPVYK